MFRERSDQVRAAELCSSEKNHDLDQTMVDRRDFSLVGYNKVTGKEVDRENIVKAYEYEADQYVVLSDPCANQKSHCGSVSVSSRSGSLSCPRKDAESEPVCPAATVKNPIE